MKLFFLILLFISSLSAKDIDLYATLLIASHHFWNDEHGNKFNDDHDAFGAEVIYDKRYSLTYVHFTNSRYKPTDITALGYRYDIFDSFGIYTAVAYQKGYCFEGLECVECTQGESNSGIIVLPMLYYRHKYFILDFITQGNMVAIKLNLKLYPY